MPSNSPADPPPEATARSYSPVALAVLTAVLLILCLALMYPFLPALAWGVALAVVALPLQHRLDRLTSRRGLAAAITTFTVTAAVLVPGAFVVYQLGREASSAAERIKEQSAEETVRGKLAQTPQFQGTVAWMDRVGFDIDREVHKTVETNTKDVSSLASGSILSFVQFGVAMFIVYYLLLDREKLLKQLRTFLPVNNEEYEQVVKSAGDSVHANLHATLVTSVIDGVGGGLMFWLLGVPSPMMWGVVMFFLSFLPLVGTWLIWIPAAAYLGITGHWPQALILMTWGAASSFVVDNVIYVRIAGDRMKLHQIPSLLAFLGGLAVFGAAGMVIGPGILAVTVAVLDVWHKRAVGEAAP